MAVADVVDALIAVAPDLRRSDSVPDVSTWVRRGATPLPCPHCAAAMEPAALGGVAVDRCRTDAIFWFDADELLDVLFRAKQQRQQREARDDGLVTRLLRFLSRPAAIVRGMTDEGLFAHYVERGAAAWNGSAEAAWMDVRLREWVSATVSRRPGMRVANVGIGVGLWDDWLGHWLGGDGTVTSLDLDPAITACLAYRQRREGHPHPATVVTGDLLDAALPAASFDLVTMVGSTATETGDPARALAAAAALVGPGGALVVMGPGAPGPLARRLVDLGLADPCVEADERYPACRFYLAHATRAR